MIARAVVIEPEAGVLRARLGPVAWCALEALAAGAASDAASLATTLGIGRDRARAAIGRLRDAGLVESEVQRAGVSGRWAGMNIFVADGALRFVHPVPAERPGAPAPPYQGPVHPPTRGVAPTAGPMAPRTAAEPGCQPGLFDAIAPRAPRDAPAVRAQ